MLCCFDEGDTKLELLTPPADAVVGERIVVDLPSVEDTHLPDQVRRFGGGKGGLRVGVGVCTFCLYMGGSGRAGGRGRGGGGPC